MTYVADTHAFLWYLADDIRLGSAARRIFDSAERGDVTMVVPTIVLAESLHILEKRRLQLEFQDILRKLATGANYTTMPLDFQVVSRMSWSQETRPSARPDMFKPRGDTALPSFWMRTTA